MFSLKGNADDSDVYDSDLVLFWRMERLSEIKLPVIEITFCLLHTELHLKHSFVMLKCQI